MEPIKIEVTIGVNVDLSQNTKDFIREVIEAQNKARIESLEKSYEPLNRLVAMAATPCCTAPAPIGPVSNASSTTGENAPEALAKPEAPAPKPQNQAAAPTVSIEDVRKVLAEKVNDHRETIKGKLEELGAPSVTKLDPSKYQEMYDFLSSL